MVAQTSSTLISMFIGVEFCRAGSTKSDNPYKFKISLRSDDEKKYVNQCYCGKSGCMETYVSGPGFANCFNLKHKTNYDSHAILEEFNN